MTLLCLALPVLSTLHKNTEHRYLRKALRRVALASRKISSLLLMLISTREMTSRALESI
jgi:hypothetical protein